MRASLTLARSSPSRHRSRDGGRRKARLAPLAPISGYHSARASAWGNALLDAPGLREHIGSRLADYKVPRYVWFLSEPLPRNANGKFLKRELKEVLDPASAD